MDTNENDLLDLKMVCSILKSRATDEDLEKTLPLSERGTQIGFVIKWQLNSGKMDQGLQGMILLMY